MKIILLLIIFIFSCGDVNEQIIGYNEIIISAWELFSENKFEQARTEFTNALDYEILNNIAEAYIGIGWCNLYIANQYTDLNDYSTRNQLRDIAFNNFQAAKTKDNEAVNGDIISDELKSILSAGLVYVYDYKLFDYNYQVDNNNDNFQCNDFGPDDNEDNFRNYCIIPMVVELVLESNNLIKNQNFNFIYDSSINMDDIHFIRAKLAYSHGNFHANEFESYVHSEVEVIDYPKKEEEICSINQLTPTCIELNIEIYCEEVEPNIPYYDFLECLSSFYTPSEIP